MRVLVNTRFLLANKLEGLGLYTHEVLSRLVQAYPQHEFVFAFDRKYDAAFVYSENVIPVVVSPPARHPFLFYCWFEWSLPRVYKKYGCEAMFSPTCFTSLHPQIDHNVLVVHDLAYLHCPDDLGTTMLAYYRRFMPKFIQRASDIITISKASFQDIASHFPTAKSKMTWSYNGVRDIFKPLAQEKAHLVRLKFTGGEQYFTVIGSFNGRKNLARIMQAFDLYRSQQSSSEKLLVVGRKGWMSSDVKEAIAASSYASDIIFTGYLSDEDLVDVLGASKALLYLSLFEGFGLPILEAMASGIPVITSNRSSMQEIAKDHAITVDPENISAIATAMTQLSNNENLRTDLIKRGLDHSATFTWQPMVKTVAAALGL